MYQRHSINTGSTSVSTGLKSRRKRQFKAFWVTLVVCSCGTTESETAVKTFRVFGRVIFTQGTNGGTQLCVLGDQRATFTVPWPKYACKLPHDDGDRHQQVQSIKLAGEMIRCYLNRC